MSTAGRSLRSGDLPRGRSTPCHVARSVRLGGLVLLLALAAAGVCPPVASGWARECKWPTQGLTTIPTNYNCDSFAPYGYDCEDVWEDIEKAQDIWNTEGGTEVRLSRPVATTNWGATSGAINYIMVDENADPSVLALTTGACSGAVVKLYANYRWDMGLPVRPKGFDFVSIAARQTGFALGLKYSNDSGSCGSSSFTGTSLMNKSYSGIRTLFYDDWTSLTTGSCAYAQSVPSGVIRVKKSTDKGNTWSTFLTWGSGSNMTPAIAYGDPGGADIWLQAKADSDNRVITWKWEGGWTGLGWVGTAMAGPTAAYGVVGGVGTWLVAFPLLTSGNEGQIRIMQGALDLSSGWARTIDTNLKTPFRVGLTWSATTSQFFMVYASMVDDPMSPEVGSPGSLQMVSSSDGITWSAPWTLTTGSPPPPAFQNDFPAGGPAITCPLWRCAIVYPDGRTSTNTLRERVFIAHSGSPTLNPSDIDQNFAFAAWNGWDTATLFDASAATYTPSLDYIFSYHTRDWGESGFVVRLDGTDTNPPPGFDESPSGPPGPGFQSGSAAFTGTQAGIGVTYDENSDTIYAIAHGT